ncbi:MAG: S41 family peptidase [Isosphaeraceae bacterium]
MTRRNFYAFSVLALISLFCWQATQGAKPKDEMMELYGLFVDAVEQVETNYVRPVNRRELLESALRGMLHNLDQHSQYINDTEWKSFKKTIEGRYGGIGIHVEIDPESERLKVLAPMVGTPAYAAGVLSGDLILEIDDNSTEGMTPDRAIEILTGRVGSSVKLQVRHELDGKSETLTMTRAIIDVPTILGDSRKADDSWDFMLDHERKIGYVRITNFFQNTTEELKKALTELSAEGMKALILDLRDDPGGYLISAVEVSDLFLDSGVIVSTKGRNSAPKVYEAQKDGLYTDFPMVILVNQSSASAAEIVSAALQDHKRAKIVGQRSYGKGSVQNLIELEGGGSVLKLTVATYHRPSGKNIHRFRNAKESDAWGVSPDKDLEVKLTPEQYIRFLRGRRARDLVLNRRSKKAATPEGDASKKSEDVKPDGANEKDKDSAKDGNKPGKTAFVDLQLEKAIAVIKDGLADATAKK